VTEVDELVRGTLRRHAEEAPDGARLLAAVHERSRRLGRRRRLAVAAVVAALVVSGGAAFAAVAPTGGPRPAPPAGVASATASAPAPTTSPTPGRAPSSPAALRFGSPGYALPTFPFRPVVTPVGGLADPVVTLAAGELTAFYAARDGERGADVTIRVGPRTPSFDAGPAHETRQQVRGKAATLRTVVVAPANRLSLYWLERPGQWVRVDTDDTLTDAELVRLADALAPAAVPVLMPFRFDVVPAGADLDTSTRSVVAFRPSGVTCALRGPQPLTGATVPVGRYRGTVRHTGTGATVTVALDDVPATLVVQVPARYPVSDADLVRFAAGIQLTADAEPGS